MAESKPLNGDVVVALFDLAGILIDRERAEQLAAESDALFAEANRVSAFIAPRRWIGLGVRFFHGPGHEEGR